MLRAGLIVGGMDAKEGQHKVSFAPLDPLEEESEEEFNNDLSGPRKVHSKSKWKVHQDAVYWIRFLAGQFWQRRVSFTPLSFTIQCLPTASQKWYPLKETKCKIRGFPRAAPKIVLKDAWHLNCSNSKAHHQAAGDRLRRKST